MLLHKSVTLVSAPEIQAGFGIFAIHDNLSNDLITAALLGDANTFVTFEGFSLKFSKLRMKNLS